jgi:hypothetical protein
MGVKCGQSGFRCGCLEETRHHLSMYRWDATIAPKNLLHQLAHHNQPITLCEIVLARSEPSTRCVCRGGGVKVTSSFHVWLRSWMHTVLVSNSIWTSDSHVPYIRLFAHLPSGLVVGAPVIDVVVVNNLDVVVVEMNTHAHHLSTYRWDAIITPACPTDLSSILAPRANVMT